MRQIALAALSPAPALAAVLAFAAPAFAQPSEGRPAPEPAIGARLSDAEHKATDIITQPVRDVGLFGRAVPEPLQRARHDPYSLAASWSCTDIDSEIARLDDALGPDPMFEAERKESRVGKVAEAGGRAVVNSLIPFRTVVREVSGAAPAERRLQTAIDIGHERRGFLRGVYQMRSCGPFAAEAPQRVGPASTIEPATDRRP